MTQNEFLDEIVSDIDLGWEMSEMENAIRNAESCDNISDVAANLNDIQRLGLMITNEARRLLKRIDNEAPKD